MDLAAVGKRVRAARQAKKLTQEELAAMADVSPTHIGVIERGQKLPNLDTFISIANALDVSADYLLQDVINKSAHVTASELSHMVGSQTPEMQRKIYSAIRALIET